MALGTEPGWTLEITPERLNYNGDYGETKIRLPNPGAARLADGGTHYAAGRLDVTIHRAPCSDGMSDRLYMDTVRLIADGKRLNGCGGEVDVAAMLNDTRWQSVRGDEAASSVIPPVRLHFAGERISGHSGCNQFIGTFRHDGKYLTPGPLTITEKACPAPVMEQERRFLDMMKGPVTIDIDAEGKMILTGKSGKAMAFTPDYIDK
ncbi:META domain-containing protein [Sphingopyxis sp. MWB1]|uniref:META domain-containing protein n=1 Tax=Sphingopyxis sp. MWB1 TaxID=1537715 RepID=UPI00068B33AF|nr:META domain-containing protein [Sphingopyxis sp. MWB1]